MLPIITVVAIITGRRCRLQSTELCKGKSKLRSTNKEDLQSLIMRLVMTCAEVPFVLLVLPTSLVKTLIIYQVGPLHRHRNSP
jgi:hypothetical protein